ncbi:hypothetical protein D3C75_741360 [compost metagenome]
MLILRTRLPFAVHQAQNRISRTGAQRHIRLMADKVATRNLVKELDDYRETNRSVQIALRNMEAEAFCYQTQTNHQQEAQAQHHDRRVLVNKVR